MVDVSNIILPIVSTVLALISLTTSIYSMRKAKRAQERLNHIREQYTNDCSYQRSYGHNSRKNSRLFS